MKEICITFCFGLRLKLDGIASKSETTLLVEHIMAQVTYHQIYSRVLCFIKTRIGLNFLFTFPISLSPPPLSNSCTHTSARVCWCGTIE